MVEYNQIVNRWEWYRIANKPAPDSVFEVLKNLQVSKEDAVYIGDSDVDLATAQNADMDHIIVTWGFREKSFLKEKGAERFADTTDDIMNIIMDV